MKRKLHYPSRLTLPLAVAAASLMPLLPLQLARAADTAAPAEPTKMEKVVVTGSLIPTAETVGPAAVQTIRTEDIDQAGTADPLLTLKKLVPSFTGGGNYLGSVNNNVNLGAGFQAFTGESYVALRNLPTLVLIDGQRVVSTALSGGQAVDLNSIPLAMIERVEVLKDGASTIYGSDAIGGVVNIITKKHFNGVQLDGRYGFPTDGPGTQGVQYQASIVAGTSTEKTSFSAGAQIFVQNPLLTRDRAIGSQSIAELAAQGVVPPSYISPSYPGKVQNPASGAGRTSWILASSPFAKGAPGYNAGLVTPPVYAGQTFSGNTTVSDYNAYAVAHGYVAPDGSGLGPYLKMSSTPVGVSLAAIGSGEGSGWPALNTTDFGTISLLEQNRRQFWGNFDHQIFDEKMSVYSTFLYSDNAAQGQLAPSPIPSLSLYGIAVPADNPYNPFGIALGANGTSNPRVRSRTVDFGNRTFQSYADFYQYVGGLKGNITPDYSYDVSFDYSQDRQEQQTRNAVNGGGLNQALQPLIVGGAQQFDTLGRPLSLLTDASGNNLPVYNIFGSSLTPGNPANAPETINQLRTTLFTWGQSELWSAQGVINGSPFSLPAGKVSFAAGGQYIDERLSLQVDGLTSLGLVPGLNAAFAFPGGSRATAAGFVEVNVPILSKDQNVPGFYDLSLNASGRYQTFDPGGDKAVPKVALRWQPIDDEFTIRASYNQGFIAPSVFNLFGPDFVSNPSVTINGATGQVTTQTRANPSLKPSNSEQWGAGIVISPNKLIKNLTVSVDYYKVTEDSLPIADAQGAANSLAQLGVASPYAGGFTYADGTRLAAGSPAVDVNNWGNLILPWQGVAALRTSGFDVSGSYVIPTESLGKFTLTAVANIPVDYKVQTSPTRAYYDYVGTWTPQQGLVPDYNLTATLAYEFRNWTYVVSGHYLPSTTDPGGLFPDPAVYQGTHGFTINGNSWTIPDYYTVDMQLSYEIGKGKGSEAKWYDGTKLTVGCNNIADAMPPLIPDGVEDNTDKNNYDILGRFVYFQVSKKF